MPRPAGEADLMQWLGTSHPSAPAPAGVDFLHLSLQGPHSLHAFTITWVHDPQI